MSAAEIRCFKQILSLFLLEIQDLSLKTVELGAPEVCKREDTVRCTVRTCIHKKKAKSRELFVEIGNEIWAVKGKKSHLPKMKNGRLKSEKLLGIFEKWWVQQCIRH